MPPRITQMRMWCVAAMITIFGACNALTAETQSFSPPSGWLSYHGTGFSISYPPGFTVDRHHEYEGIGSGNAILGTAFKIPASMTEGTNLSPDSYLSVEIFPQITCTPKAFLASLSDQPPVKEDGRQWLVANSSEGAAGNQYDETVYALDKSVPCIAVRTVIHSTNIANYDPGTVKPFDVTQLKALFDKMRGSLQTQQPPQKS